MTTLTKDEIIAWADTCRNGSGPVDLYLFAHLCRADLVAEVGRLTKKVAERSAEYLAAHITYDKGYEEGRLDAEAKMAGLEAPPCSDHPDAPHGFNRNASHNAGRYVCDCEGWRP